MRPGRPSRLLPLAVDVLTCPPAACSVLVARLTQVIARNALKQESEEDIYLPDTIDVTEQKPAAGRTCC